MTEALVNLFATMTGETLYTIAFTVFLAAGALSCLRRPAGRIAAQSMLPATARKPKLVR